MMALSDSYSAKSGERELENQIAQLITSSKARRDMGVERLKELLPVRRRELIAEQQKPCPDATRVAILRRIVNDLQQTVNSAQRQR